jgi:hypothetical protein
MSDIEEMMRHMRIVVQLAAETDLRINTAQAAVAQKQAELAAEQAKLAAEQAKLSAERSKLPVVELLERKVSENDDFSENYDFQLAMMLSLDVQVPTDWLDANSRMADRKRREEAQTRAVLGDVYQIESAVEVRAGGVLLVDNNKLFKLKECGNQFGGHSNLCGYLALTDGDGPAAVALKLALAPAATKFSTSIGRGTDFSGVSTMMDTEVLRAFVVNQRRTVCIYNAAAGAGVTLYTDASLGSAVVYVHTDGGHFQRMVQL